MNATRIAVRLLSWLMLFAYLLFAMVIGAASGLSDASSPVNVRMLALLASPFVYCVCCLFSTFGHWRKVPLLVLCIAAHLTIIPFVIRLVSDSGWIFTLPIAVMAICWAVMFFELERKDGV